ncbi:hypothetical protein [Azospirillum doebereinerae]
MTDTPDERPSPQRPNVAAGQPTPRDETPAEQRSPREDMRKTPGDGTLQDATPAGLSSKELLERADEIDGSAQPGTG